MVITKEEINFLREVAELPGWHVLKRWAQELANNAASKALSPTTKDMDEVNRQRGAHEAMVTFVEEIELAIEEVTDE